MMMMEMEPTITVSLPAAVADPLRPSRYPAPLATHEEVRTNKQRFVTTLTKFVQDMGTSLGRIPHVAGKELDLHILYVQVTEKGGLQAVIKDKLWKEISAVFEFPPTCTSGSFTLRKYYIKLLHDYEQVYFFRKTGAPIPAPYISSSSKEGGSPSSTKKKTPKKEGKSSKGKRGRPKQPPPPVLGSRVNGIVDQRFEWGYFVTMNIHGEEMKGIIYHQPESRPPGEAFQPVFMPQLSSQFTQSVDSGGRGRKRHKLDKKDPNAPKPNKTAFNFFSVEARKEAKKNNPDMSEKEISAVVGQMWKMCEERQQYVDEAERDKQRYMAAREDYLKSKGQTVPATMVVGGAQYDHTTSASVALAEAMAAVPDPTGNELSTM